MTARVAGDARGFAAASAPNRALFCARSVWVSAASRLLAAALLVGAGASATLAHALANSSRERTPSLLASCLAMSSSTCAAVRICGCPRTGRVRMALSSSAEIVPFPSVSKTRKAAAIAAWERDGGMEIRNNK